MTDPLGQSQVLPYLIGLGKKGYRFTLISFEKQGRYETAKHTIDQLCANNGIDWHPLIYTKNPPVLSTLIDIRTLKAKIKELYKTNRYDLVHCRSYITAIAGQWMKNKWPVKFVFDMRGFWADERVDGGLWPLKNPVYNVVYGYFKRKESQFLHEADHTISLTHNAKQEIESWDINKSFAPIEVIPCCVDLELFDPDSIDPAGQQELKRSLKIEHNQKVLTYIGSLGTWYMLDEMVEFFDRFLVSFPGSVFLFITKENSEEVYHKFVSKGISRGNLRVVSAERKQMPLYISLSDYSIFFIKPSYSKKASSPTKQGEIMAMGIPMICNADVGDTSDVVERYNSGVFLKRFTQDDYDQVIQKLIAVKFCPGTIRKGANEFYSLANGIEKYSGVYQKTLG
jgi:glycosyltransferase involved in cell wall biosynthesis